MRRATARRKQVAVPAKEAKILWLLTFHPELSDQAIADAAGCSRTSLYRMPRFRRMRELTRAGRAEWPRGWKWQGGPEARSPEVADEE